MDSLDTYWGKSLFQFVHPRHLSGLHPEPTAVMNGRTVHFALETIGTTMEPLAGTSAAEGTVEEVGKGGGDEEWVFVGGE